MINLVVKIIKFFPPEISHSITIKLLKLGFLSFVKKPSKSFQILKQVIWNLEFNNPLGLAAGFDKNGDVVDQVLNLGFSFTEIGTVTPNPQKGNKKPRIFRLKKNKALINRLGFNNKGMYKLKKKLAYRHKKIYSTPGIIGINISRNYDSNNNSSDYIKCIETLGEYCDYIAINVSSPNTPGLRDLQKRSSLEELIISIKKIKNINSKISKKPLMIKISPDIDEEQKKDIALTCLAQSIDGIIISNTTINREYKINDKYFVEAGGLSGKPLFEISTQLLKEMFIYTGGKIPLIGVGGINSGRDAYEKIKAGASLVQIYTALTYEGPSIIEKINNELIHLLEADGFSNISQAIGIDSR